MPKKQPEAPDPKLECPFGELDGEPIEIVIISVRGSGILDRVPGDGERIVLTVEGNAKPAVVKRVNGRLVREHAIAIERLAEPLDELAEEVERFIQEVDDRRSGKLQLPFDPETGEVLEPEEPEQPGEPEPGEPDEPGEQE